MERAGVPFDIKHFENQRKAGKKLTTEETFKEIFQSNHWSNKESVSGSGSADQQTREISRQIPILVEELGIKTFLDVPCGDYNWFSKMELNLDAYIGGDIIADIIDKNNNQFGGEHCTFIQIDLIKDTLPQADMVFCRDCLVHLSHHDIHKVINNLKQSTIAYFLTTTFSACDENKDIVTGDWRIINLEKAPFNFPKPLKLINEKCTEGEGTYVDKCLGLWKISEL